MVTTHDNIMSLEDPFFVVKQEVQKAVGTAKGLYQRWKELLEDGSAGSKEEYDWTTKELRNSLRSIDWDLEDLEETVGIVEKNPRKFKISGAEVQERKNFISNTRSTVKKMKEHLSNPATRGKEETNVRQSLLNGSTRNSGPNRSQDRYTRLDNDIVESNQRFIDDTRQQQQQIIHQQDEQLEVVATTVGTLKDMTHRIGNELDEQAIMLDEFGHEIDNTGSRMDSTMKKIAKVLHMSNDRRQWCAIAVLLVVLIIVIILFVTL